MIIFLAIPIKAFYKYMMKRKGKEVMADNGSLAKVM
jgi:hypothetical protein